MEEFWKKKKLFELTEEEWESVCLKCGKCCMIKYHSDRTVFFSRYVCRHLNRKTGLCSRYKDRLKASGCAKVNMKLLLTMPEMLPETCAYRLLLQGKDLPDYHPLITHDENSVLKAGKTVLAYKLKPESDREERSLFDEFQTQAKKENWHGDVLKQKLDEYCKQKTDVFVEHYPKMCPEKNDLIIVKS